MCRGIEVHNLLAAAAIFAGRKRKVRASPAFKHFKKILTNQIRSQPINTHALTIASQPPCQTGATSGEVVEGAATAEGEEVVLLIAVGEAEAKHLVATERRKIFSTSQSTWTRRLP